MIRMVFALAFIISAFTGAVQAQEENVRPGINDAYQNTGFDTWVQRFETPGREVYDKRHEIVAAGAVKAGMTVADIGAGTGLFTRLFARLVGESGKVYAVDISPLFIENIARINQEQGINNVSGVVGKTDDITLPPASIDTAFICDTYHHFEYPATILHTIHTALRPQGTMTVIDFQKIPGTSSAWVMGHVRADKAKVIKEIERAGFALIEDNTAVLTSNYFLRFRKK